MRETSTHIDFQSSVFAWIELRNQAKLVAIPRRQPSTNAGALSTKCIVGTVVTVRVRASGGVERQETTRKLRGVLKELPL